ncbi:unnamed protein product [Allacma fusca]|uniref:Dynein axonemal assembly factor 1 homolog n=1 Tax=Allacma fusca TaxID=39272 RepID=A0A8J2PML9_9HEXA|nr:unnamed protein product [Allacma fusca]
MNIQTVLTTGCGDVSLASTETGAYKGVRMTKEILRQHCREKKLYTTPYLNDVLYLHFKGFSEIENLEEYTGLKSLWLESNGIRVISNLDAQTELRCLYLQQNLIKKIENIEHLKYLDTINLSNNLIKKIENLSNIPKLNTLQISRNYLETPEDIEHLTECDTLSVLDISHNQLEDQSVLGVFARMKSLRVLNLMGNPCIRKIENYRRNMVNKCVNLTFLDDRPVFDKERACCAAWATGGRKAEQEERDRWAMRDQQKIQDSVNALISLRDRKQREKQERMAREEEERIAREESEKTAREEAESTVEEKSENSGAESANLNQNSTEADVIAKNENLTTVQITAPGSMNLDDPIWDEVKEDELNDNRPLKPLETDSESLKNAVENNNDTNNGSSNDRRGGSAEPEPNACYFQPQLSVEPEEEEIDTASEENSSTEVSESESIFLAGIKQGIISYKETLEHEALLQKRSFSPEKEPDEDITNALAVDLAEAAIDLPSGEELKQCMQEVMMAGDNVFHHDGDSDTDSEISPEVEPEEESVTDSGLDVCEVDSSSQSIAPDSKILEEFENELILTLKEAQNIKARREQAGDVVGDGYVQDDDMEITLKDKCRPVISKIIASAEEIVNGMMEVTGGGGDIEVLFNAPRDPALAAAESASAHDDGIEDTAAAGGSSNIFNNKPKPVNTWDTCWEIGDVKSSGQKTNPGMSGYCCSHDKEIAEIAKEQLRQHYQMSRSDTIDSTCSSLAREPEGEGDPDEDGDLTPRNDDL